MSISRGKELRLSMRVWDIPTRLFHWALVVLVAACYVTEQAYWMDLHFLCGYAVLTLLIFRIVWGFLGSQTARFGNFVKNPVLAARHLARLFRREPDDEIGHNPAGGWMVLLLLALLLVSAVSGLFSNDDIAAEGPLAKYVSKYTSDIFSGVHDIVWDFLLAAIVLHILAILAYAVFKGQNLVRPMITGKKRLPATLRPPRMANPLLAVAVFLISIALVFALVSFS